MIEQATVRRLTSQEAAEVLGTSVHTLRIRVRSSFHSEKSDDRVNVWMDDDAYGNHNTVRLQDEVESSALAEELREQVRYHREQLDREREARTEERRRHDTLMAQLMQRIPEIEPLRERPEAPETVEEEPEGAERSRGLRPQGLRRPLSAARCGGGCLADRKPTNGTEAQSAQEDRDDQTTFGTALSTLLVGCFFVFCAVYLGPYPAPFDSIVKTVCVLLAAVCFVFFVGFWGVAMSESPEMGTFFKAIWGGGERGWLYLGRTTIFVVVGFALHLVVVAGLLYLSKHVGWLGWAKYVAWAAELVVVVFALFASVMLAYALDYFFIVPILEKTKQGGEALETLIQAVRTRGAVVVPTVIALIALWWEITHQAP